MSPEALAQAMVSVHAEERLRTASPRWRLRVCGQDLPYVISTQEAAGRHAELFRAVLADALRVALARTGVPPGIPAEKLRQIRQRWRAVHGRSWSMEFIHEVPSELGPRVLVLLGNHGDAPLTSGEREEFFDAVGNCRADVELLLRELDHVCAFTRDLAQDAPDALRLADEGYQRGFTHGAQAQRRACVAYLRECLDLGSMTRDELGRVLDRTRLIPLATPEEGTRHG